MENMRFGGPCKHSGIPGLCAHCRVEAVAKERDEAKAKLAEAEAEIERLRGLWDDEEKHTSRLIREREAAYAEAKQWQEKAAKLEADRQGLVDLDTERCFKIAGLEKQVQELAYERDAYKKAKAENDDRFMGEADTFRHELETISGIVGAPFTVSSGRLPSAVQGMKSKMKAAEHERDYFRTRAHAAEDMVEALKTELAATKAHYEERLDKSTRVLMHATSTQAFRDQRARADAAEAQVAKLGAELAELQKGTKAILSDADKALKENVKLVHGQEDDRRRIDMLTERLEGMSVERDEIIALCDDAGITSAISEDILHDTGVVGRVEWLADAKRLAEARVESLEKRLAQETEGHERQIATAAANAKAMLEDSEKRAAKAEQIAASNHPDLHVAAQIMAEQVKRATDAEAKVAELEKKLAIAVAVGERMTFPAEDDASARLVRFAATVAGRPEELELRKQIKLLELKLGLAEEQVRTLAGKLAAGDAGLYAKVEAAENEMRTFARMAGETEVALTRAENQITEFEQQVEKQAATITKLRSDRQIFANHLLSLDFPFEQFGVAFEEEA